MLWIDPLSCDTARTGDRMFHSPRASHSSRELDALSWILIRGPDRQFGNRARSLLERSNLVVHAGRGVYRDLKGAILRLASVRPSIILIHTRALGPRSGRGIRRLTGAAPDAEVVLIAKQPDDPGILEALRTGASGCVLEEFLETELVPAMERVRAGAVPLSPGVAKRLLDRWRELQRPSARQPVLSPREREVLEHLRRGRLYKEVGQEMRLSYHTVRAHVRRIYAKLGARSRRSALQKAGMAMQTRRPRPVGRTRQKLGS